MKSFFKRLRPIHIIILLPVTLLATFLLAELTEVIVDPITSVQSPTMSSGPAYFHNFGQEEIILLLIMIAAPFSVLILILKRHYSKRKK